MDSTEYENKIGGNKSIYDQDVDPLQLRFVNARLGLLKKRTELLELWNSATDVTDLQDSRNDSLVTAPRGKRAVTGGVSGENEFNWNNIMQNLEVSKSVSKTKCDDSIVSEDDNDDSDDDSVLESRAFSAVSTNSLVCALFSSVSALLASLIESVAEIDLPQIEILEETTVPMIVELLDGLLHTMKPFGALHRRSKLSKEIKARISSILTNATDLLQHISPAQFPKLWPSLIQLSFVLSVFAGSLAQILTCLLRTTLHPSFSIVTGNQTSEHFPVFVNLFLALKISVKPIDAVSKIDDQIVAGPLVNTQELLKVQKLRHRLHQYKTKINLQKGPQPRRKSLEALALHLQQVNESSVDHLARCTLLRTSYTCIVGLKRFWLILSAALGML